MTGVTSRARSVDEIRPAMMTMARGSRPPIAVALVITHDDFGFTATDRLVDLMIETMLSGLIRKG